MFTETETGDFTLNTHDDEAKVDHIDYLYLDNTSSDPHSYYCTKEECVKYLIPALKMYPKNAKFYVACENYGKEELLELMARKINTKVVVDSARLKHLRRYASTIGINSKFFTDSHSNRARIIAMNTTKVNERAIRKLNETEFAVGVKPTSRANNQKETRAPQHDDTRFIPLSLTGEESLQALKENSLNKDSMQRMIYIPYSLHSSHKELHDFVSKLRPTKIYGFVHENDFSIKSLSRYCDRDSQRLRRLRQFEENIKGFASRFGQEVSMNVAVKQKVRRREPSGALKLLKRQRIQCTSFETIRQSSEKPKISLLEVCDIIKKQPKPDSKVHKAELISGLRGLTSDSNQYKSKIVSGQNPVKGVIIQKWTPHQEKLALVLFNLKQNQNNEMASKLHSLLLRSGQSVASISLKLKTFKRHA